MRVPLDDLEITKGLNPVDIIDDNLYHSYWSIQLLIIVGKDDSSKRSTKDLEHLEEDLATLNQITELVSSLHVSHNVIDEAIKEVQNGIQRQLSEKQLATEPHLATIDLAISTQ